jgi:hypothetical protein
MSLIKLIFWGAFCGLYSLFETEATEMTKNPKCHCGKLMGEMIFFFHLSIIQISSFMLLHSFYRIIPSTIGLNCFGPLQSGACLARQLFCGVCWTCNEIWGRLAFRASGNSQLKFWFSTRWLANELKFNNVWGLFRPPNWNLHAK